jgi:hypothetical protein
MIKGFNIQTTTRNTLLAISLLLLLHSTVNGQPEASFGDSYFCENTSVHMPMFVNNFNEISSLTLIIHYGRESLEFIDVMNPHPDLSNGNFMWESIQNNDHSYVVITWLSAAEPLSVGNASLFDLHFNYSEGVALIEFSDECEISVDLVPQNEAVFNNGTVAPLQMISQPADQFVGVNEPATFLISLNGESNFQWQENAGEGWMNISDNSLFAGTATNQLMIAHVTQSMDNHQYRCLASKNECIIYSDAATLTVSSTNVGDRLSNRHPLIVFPNPFKDEFSYSTTSIADRYDIQLINLRGEVVFHAHRLKPNRSDIETVNLSGQQPGIYFLKVHHGENMKSCIKLLKQ